MALAQWPTGVPAPLINSKREQTSGLVNENDVLNPERSKRLPDYEIDIVVMCSNSEFATFKTFVDITLCDGQAAFEAPWLSYLRLTNHVAVFDMPYSASLVGGFFRVGANLRVINAGVS